jgi:hypothetical protein
VAPDGTAIAKLKSAQIEIDFRVGYFDFKQSKYNPKALTAASELQHCGIAIPYCCREIRHLAAMGIKIT